MHTKSMPCSVKVASAGTMALNLRSSYCVHGFLGQSWAASSVIFSDCIMLCVRCQQTFASNLHAVLLLHLLQPPLVPLAPLALPLMM